LKRLIFGIIIIILCVGALGSSLAYFTDVESSTNNTFTMGEVYEPPSPEPNRYYLTNPDNNGGIVIIPAGATVLFISDHSALEEVVYPAGDWAVVMKTDSDWSAFCGVIIEESNYPGGNLTANSDTPVIMTLSVNNPAIDVQAGNYLGIRITNNDVIDHSCIVDGNSYVSAPTGVPIPSVPEMPAGFLLAAGLTGLGAFIYFRKKPAVSRG
jgi:predicted ribosomally synthesized peptide with SipW-like signal peptide